MFIVFYFSYLFSLHLLLLSAWVVFRSPMSANEAEDTGEAAEDH